MVRFAKWRAGESLVCLSFSPEMTYPNLTACSSGPEARICIFLIPFGRKHFEVYGNVKGM
jgi:hypothetical protein